jgi:GTP-binding protein
MTKPKTPIVAIVGRANVGKSSFYNAVVGQMQAIVAREAGTTRDSLMSKVNWKQHDFWLIDTAGVKDPEDDFEFTIQEQIYQAAESADLILLMTEAHVPISDEDRKIALIALKSKKPVLLVVNKIDQVKDINQIDHIKKVGIKEQFLISVTQRKGINNLLDKISSLIPKVEEAKDSSKVIRVALIGRPNVGKSNLFNALIKKQLAIVSKRAGTTRDVNYAQVNYHQQKIEFLDTAGIRRSGKIEVGIEKFSVLRTIQAIEMSDICLLLMESNQLNTQLDQKLAGIIKDASKGLIIVVSKWDIVENKDPFLRDNLAAEIKNTFDFVPWAPLIFTSSKSGQNVTKLFDLIIDISRNQKTKIQTSELNRWLEKVIYQHPPAGLKNRTPKLNYIVQEIDNQIPAFKIFGSNTKFIHWSYKRYLEKQLRTDFGFEGSAIELWFIEKHVTHKHGHSPTRD